MIYRQLKMITVGITNYNAEKYIEKCIESIIDQTYDNVEFIIVDDNSTDGSIGILKALEKENPDIIVIYHSENSGSPDLGRDQIISKAHGHYFILVDSDDFFPDKHTFEIFIKGFEENKEIDYVTADILLVDGDGNKKETWESKQFSHDEIVNLTLISGGSGVLNMKGLFKTSFFRENNLNYLSNFTAGDTVTALQCIKYGMQYRHINVPVICYRQHEANFTFDFSKRIKAILNVINYIFDNFDEKICFPKIEWWKLSHDKTNATKLFLFGVVYFEIFTAYLNEDWMPWQTNLTIDKKNSSKILNKFKNIIITFLSNSLKIDRIHEKSIKNILKKINSLNFTEIQ